MNDKKFNNAARGTVKTNLRRIDISLDELIRDIAKKNEISIRQASKELAKMVKPKIRGMKLIEEIRF